MLLGTLDAGLLEILLTGKDTIISGKSTIRVVKDF